MHPGDWVWLHLRKERFPQKRRNKLSERGDGPFRVLERINDNAYKIELPEEYGIHATFNVADLKLFERADEQEADRLKDQPAEGGGDDKDVETRTNLPIISLRPGPISRGSANTFINKVLNLFNTFDAFNSIPDNSSYSFKRLINPGMGMKLLITLSDN